VIPHQYLRADFAMRVRTSRPTRRTARSTPRR
jgi:hypothetical protein